MSRYADSLLADGESITFRTRQHWLAPIIDARNPWAIFLVSLVVLVLSTNLDGGIRTIVGYLVLAGLVISIAWLVKVYWNWLSEDYIVTNRRVLKVEGIINKRSADSSLEKINDAVLEQNLFGRLLNYGDLDILTAADIAVDRYRMLNRAPQFKRMMLNEKHELEGEFGRPFPAPPLRSGPPTPVQTAAPAPPPAAPAPREMSADEVTRALANLADLRDRGAISADEYEGKKADLLGRL
jgi:Bacterial PH domain/Short C-terminal domain